jgi:hypothetical protein
MSTLQENLNAIMDTKEEFVSYAILAFTLILIFITIFYIVFKRGQMNRETDRMDDLYPSNNGEIRPINETDPNCKFKFYDYYIKTAYNACSGGDYSNSYVNVGNLKAIIRNGARAYDFAIYSVNDAPVVATSTTKDFYVKETFNYVNFADVMKTINDYAFAAGSSPNYTDPVILHLRFMSNNQNMYSNLAKIFESYTDIMLGKEYSYEYSNQNLGTVPILNFMNKIVLIVDRSNTAYLENEALAEYVNMTSGSVFMRLYDYYGIKNNPDINELQDYNRTNMTIVIPNNERNPENPSGPLCREAGCQLVAFRYQYSDAFLAENNSFFNDSTYAFSLKPERLRYIPVTIPEPEKQKEEYSYATRNVSSDFYNYNI